MTIEILMPALSPTMEEGTLAKWLVKEGDTVASGDLLAEIETDKATMEFEAVDEGVIGKILVADGSEGVKVNTPIAVLLEEGETAADIGTPPTKSAPAIVHEAPPAAAPQTAPQTPVAVVSTAAISTQPVNNKRVFASPLARRLAADKGLDLTTIAGSGPHGRIVKADVEGAGAAPKSTSAPALMLAQHPATTPVAPDAKAIMRLYEDRDFTEIKLDGMRKIIASRLTEAKQTIPHFYLRRDVQLDALLALRSQLNKGLAAREIKLSVNDFIIKACALALQAVPAANAVWAGDRILQLKPSDVAVAVAIEGGLFTPVLKDADSRSLSSLSVQMKDLAARARNRKLAPEEYQGGSFAISNLGMFGIDSFDAVINPPHGAILAVGAGKKRPIIDAEGNVSSATVMTISMSVDHRVIDGALGAKLLNAIVENLENPLSALA